jgi:hypothetical protein
LAIDDQQGPRARLALVHVLVRAQSANRGVAKRVSVST